MEKKDAIRRALFPPRYKDYVHFISKLVDCLILIRYDVFYRMMDNNGDVSTIILVQYVEHSFKGRIIDAYKEGYYLVTISESFSICCIPESVKEILKSRIRMGDHSPLNDFSYWFDLIDPSKDNAPKGYVHIWDVMKMDLDKIDFMVNVDIFCNDRIQRVKSLKKGYIQSFIDCLSSLL